ncbi:hypothetical protein SODALDRAFT_346357 [Sodiomyces alkalinus F11]|uniref:Uncharacterized protein n=1 Tax=Sodiomyces alkalinus (strain CBS 110278 / VKM F-3762 / F11) TaxID=1314773 RepID=A0A3N2PLY3_SODAK|nr:hypothetical protein SODALDRAFT_346357 [Sodiomyces alkalinus F11]ROT35420.1 hypothetical protein SODALDRAFT_346357 [Sodiomyces alkalinus F11]
MAYATCNKDPPEVTLKHCARCKNAHSGASSPPKGLDQPITKPFTCLENGTWLHDRSEMDVYRLLIDVFRIRIEDNYTHGTHTEGTIMAGEPHSLQGFRDFIPLTGKLHHSTSSDDNWHNLYCYIEKSDVVEHYGDPQFPMQLRQFAEALYGNSPGGIDGTAVRTLMVQVESGLKQGHISLLDTSGMVRR